MAKLNDSLEITGRLSEYSFYRMKGVDKIIMRRGKGPSRKKIAKDPQYVNTRYYNMEWQGCTKATYDIRLAMIPLHMFADYNFTPELNKLNKKIQKLTTVGRLGER